MGFRTLLSGLATGVKVVFSVFGVFGTMLKDLYGVTRSAAGYLNLADITHALAVAVTVFVTVLQAGSGVLSFFAGFTADLSSWVAAIAAAFAMGATLLQKWQAGATPPAPTP